MGLNLRLHVYKKGDEHPSNGFFQILMSELSIPIKKELDGLDFNSIFQKIYFDFTGTILAVTESPRLTVILDPNHSLLTYDKPQKIKKLTNTLGGTFFSMTNGDTAGVYSYSFYKDGTEIRSVWINEEEDEISREGTKTIYEMEGKNYPFDVMEAFAISFEDFKTLNWRLIYI